MVFSDFVRARRLFLDTAALGHPAVNQSSITSLNVAKRSRRGSGDASSARNARQLVEITLGVGLVDAFDFAAGSVREPDPCHPPLLAFVPPHGRALGHV
jgi:hypothetical protein